MKLIETKTLVSAAASIEFTSIPQTYTDLVFLIISRSSEPGTDSEAGSLTFNSNTADYSRLYLNGSGTTLSSGIGTIRLAFYSPRVGTTANTFGNSCLYIPNYTLAIHKSYSGDSVTETNGSAGTQSLIAGKWANTAAITSVLLAPNAGNFVTGTTISLYGILKGSDGITTAT